MADETTNPSTDAKSVFTSKTVIGIIIASLPSVLSAFGINVAAGFASGAQSVVDAAITLGGAAIALWGRLTATKSLILFPKK